MSNQTTSRLQLLLDRHQAGDDSARDALVEHSLGRFRVLARRMLAPHRDLRALDETDDVLQLALVRLHRALDEIRPPNVAAFYGLAARHIRWVLHDLARKAAARPVAYAGSLPPGTEPRDPATEPSGLAEWTEFHQRIGRLPAEEREAFDLLLYQGLTQEEAADLLGVSLRTLKRRWQRARLLLRDALRGDWPGGDSR